MVKTITKRCRNCRTDISLRVHTEDVEKYDNGMSVQDAFPYLTPGEREMFISQFCEACFDAMFKDSEEEDYVQGDDLPEEDETKYCKTTFHTVCPENDPLYREKEDPIEYALDHIVGWKVERCEDLEELRK
jgi:hypothetical protein